MFGAAEYGYIMQGTIMANLFYLIGASGAGKDSLMQYMRKEIPASAPVVFAHRYITRSADAGGENHVALRVPEFLLRKKLGCLAMSWYSHETHYGIGIEINAWLSLGLDVVVNGSRGYLAEAARQYPNLIPVLITVDSDVLLARLRSRGRETEEQISKRIHQAIELEKNISHPALLKIGNDGLLQDAGKRLLDAVLYRVTEECV